MAGVSGARTLRVFHIPSHLVYVGKVCHPPTFEPVPQPGGTPLGVGQLLACASWAFFDVVHLHTVELASEGELHALQARRLRAGKGLVVTVHDLVPNIETDGADHVRKLRLVVEQADAVVTLTEAAAERIRGWRPDVRVVPHGRAVPAAVCPARPLGQPGGPVAAFGALRPNRALAPVIAAHQRLGTQRPRLRIMLRSVTEDDERRDHELLTYLREVAAGDPRVEVTVRRHMVSDAELVAWLSGVAALLLPYRSITHSGQLELAYDLGVPALVPDISTLRAQTRQQDGAVPELVWFPPEALTERDLGPYLQRGAQASTPAVAEHRALQRRRQEQDVSLVKAYAAVYGLAYAGQ